MIDGDGSELGDFMFHVFVVLFELIDSGMKVGNFVLGFTFVVLHEDIVRVFVEIALGWVGDEFGHLSLEKIAVLVFDVGEFSFDLLDWLAEVFADVEGEVFVVEFGEKLR